MDRLDLGGNGICEGSEGDVAGESVRLRISPALGDDGST